jgi:hypothetical protein
VAGLFKGKRPAGTSEPIVLKSLAFISTGTATNFCQDLQSVFVFSPWQKNDLIQMDAYDESGIDGIAWESAQHAPELSLTPATLPGSADGNGWMTLRVRDRAGNLSTPLHVPTCGRR